MPLLTMPRMSAYITSGRKEQQKGALRATREQAYRCKVWLLCIFSLQLKFMRLKWNSTFIAAIITRTMSNSINNLSIAGHLTFLDPSDDNWDVMDSGKLGSVLQNFSHNSRRYLTVLSCSSIPIQVWHTKYPKSYTDFWKRLSLEKEVLLLHTPYQLLEQSHVNRFLNLVPGKQQPTVDMEANRQT